MIQVLGYIFVWLFFYSICGALATVYVGEGKSKEEERRRRRVTIALAVVMTIFEAAYICHDLSVAPPAK